MQNNQDKNNLIHEWIARAEDDELSIIAELKYKEGSPSVVCFLSQQMSEKYLKALILFFTGDYPKIHDLDQLTTFLTSYIDSIKQLLKKKLLF